MNRWYTDPPPSTDGKRPSTAMTVLLVTLLIAILGGLAGLALYTGERRMCRSWNDQLSYCQTQPAQRMTP